MKIVKAVEHCPIHGRRIVAFVRSPRICRRRREHDLRCSWIVAGGASIAHARRSHHPLGVVGDSFDDRPTACDSPQKENFVAVALIPTPEPRLNQRLGVRLVEPNLCERQLPPRARIGFREFGRELGRLRIGSSTCALESLVHGVPKAIVSLIRYERDRNRIPERNNFRTLGTESGERQHCRGVDLRFVRPLSAARNRARRAPVNLGGVVHHNDARTFCAVDKKEVEHRAVDTGRVADRIDSRFARRIGPGRATSWVRLHLGSRVSANRCRCQDRQGEERATH